MKSPTVKELQKAVHEAERQIHRPVIKWGRYEIRLNEDRTIDEIVGPDFHLEQMADNDWWLGIGKPKNIMHVGLYCKTRAKIRCNAATEDGKVEEGQFYNET